MFARLFKVYTGTSATVGAVIGGLIPALDDGRKMDLKTRAILGINNGLYGATRGLLFATAPISFTLLRAAGVKSPLAEPSWERWDRLANGLSK